MENNMKIPTKEELKYLDLTPENVDKVFLFSTLDSDNKIIETNDDSKYRAMIKEINLCDKPNDMYPPVYVNMFNFVETRGVVSDFIRQLRICFLNKGLKPDDPRYKKVITKDYARLKICDGKTNMVPMKDGEGMLKYATMWADQNHTKSLDKLLYLAIGHNFMEPLKITKQKDKEGNPILAIDTTKGLLPGIIPQMSKETKESLEEVFIARMKKPTAPTAPSGQGEDGSRE